MKKVKPAAETVPSPDRARVDTYVHPGDFISVSGFNPAEDKLILDTGVGVYDGLLPPLGTDIYDGLIFFNSKGTAEFRVMGSVDTLIEGRANGALVIGVTLTGVAPSALHAWNIYGG